MDEIGINTFQKKKRGRKKIWKILILKNSKA